MPARAMFFSRMRNLRLAILAGLAMIIISPFIPWVEMNVQIYPAGEEAIRKDFDELASENGVTFPEIRAGSASRTQDGFEVLRGKQALILAVVSAILYLVVRKAWRFYVLICSSALTGLLAILALRNPVYHVGGRIGFFDRDFFEVDGMEGLFEVALQPREGAYLALLGATIVLIASIVQLVKLRRMPAPPDPADAGIPAPVSI